MGQGSLLASDIKMYIGICLGDVPFTRKQHITNTSLLINNSNPTFTFQIKDSNLSRSGHVAMVNARDKQQCVRLVELGELGVPPAEFFGHVGAET